MTDWNIRGNEYKHDFKLPDEYRAAFKKFLKGKKKKNRRFNIEDIQYSIEGTIDDAIAKLRELKKTHKKYESLRLEVTTESDYYGDSQYARVYLYGEKLETQEEFDSRMLWEFAQKTRSEEWQRQQYEQLKAKFEG